MDTFDKNYFLTAGENILDNENGLRKIQREAYIEICNHFLIKKSTDHAVAILPTGSGKTGVMAISPYGIARGRVLIITPQLVIKDHVLDSLDPSNVNNFWLRHNILQNFEELPKVVEYDKDTFIEELIESNIVILNIHKLSAQSRNSLLHKVDQDFFDMIIIDEAHHSPAQTWQNSLEYFSDAKVLKVTGTPFRTDRQKIEGHVVINYRLGKAMNDGIVKTLKNFVLMPEKVHLTIDGDDSKKYTLKELEVLKIKDKDYITRSVAYSSDCNKQIVDASIKELLTRREESSVPHKIIAVCCSIKHANDVKELYEATSLRVVIVHSKLPKKDKVESLRKIESHQADVVIHVAMLGEGYDHPYLSVAAIFRPYRSLAPYSQFIGRILRKIPNKESKNELDNIGVVIAHRDLDLDSLWQEYKQEQEYCDVLESVQQSERKEKGIEGKLKNPKPVDIGSISVDGDILTEEEYYEYTEAAEAYEAYEQEIQKKADQLKQVFPDKSEDALKKLARQQSNPKNINPLLKNPRKYRMMLRSEFADKIQQDIPASLIAKFHLKKEGKELGNLPVNREYSWVLRDGDNAAIIAKYLNAVLGKKFGPREKWTINDYHNANDQLDNYVEHLQRMIKSLLN
jgi:superfamily II DNA or RNA helicase